MMALADVALYAAVLAAWAWSRWAVTTNLAIHFPGKPGPMRVLARCR